MENTKSPPFFLFIVLTSLASFFAVLYSPALPLIVKYFDTTTSTVKASVYLYLIAYAIGGVVYAPISNRYGRRPTLFLGLWISLLGCILCILSYFTKAISLLEIGRFIQALGSSAGLQIAYTLTSESYTGKKRVRMIAYLMLGFALMPNIGIVLGGFLTQHLGWESCFYFMFLFTFAIVLWSKYAITETLKEKILDATKLTKIKNSFSSEFKNLPVTYGGIIMGLNVSLIYTFATIAPFICITYLKMDPQIFGILYFVPPAFLAAGSFASAEISKYIHPKKLIIYGIIFTTLCSIFMLIAFALGYINTWVLFGSYSLALIGITTANGMTVSQGIFHAADKAIASSVLNFLNLLYCSIPIFIASLLTIKFLLFLPLVFVTQSLLLFVFYFFFIKSIRKKEKKGEYGS